MHTEGRARPFNVEEVRSWRERRTSVWDARVAVVPVQYVQATRTDNHIAFSMSNSMRKTVGASSTRRSTRNDRVKREEISTLIALCAHQHSQLTVRASWWASRNTRRRDEGWEEDKACTRCVGSRRTSIVALTQSLRAPASRLSKPIETHQTSRTYLNTHCALLISFIV